MEKQQISNSVSVIMPAYNSSLWIKESLDSIIAQTYPVVEIIVVDDGSIDNTAELVRLYPEPVKYIYQEHHGVSSARNMGIRMAKGEFLAFIDSDDYWHPGKVELQIKLLIEDDLDWVSCASQPFDSISRQNIDGLTSPMQAGNILKPLIMRNFIGSATPIVRKSVFNQVGYFNEAYDARIGEDWDMWLRIASSHPLGVVRESLVFQRLHPTSTMSLTSMNDKVHCLLGVVERAVNRNPDELRPLFKEALANIYYSAGVQLVRRNCNREAREYFILELQFRPLKIESWIYLAMSITGPNISIPLIKLKRLIWKCLGNQKY